MMIGHTTRPDLTPDEHATVERLIAVLMDTRYCAKSPLVLAKGSNKVGGVNDTFIAPDNWHTFPPHIRFVVRHILTTTARLRGHGMWLHYSTQHQTPHDSITVG